MAFRKAVNVLSMTFYCEWLGTIVVVPISETYFRCQCDPCGRYENEIEVEFECQCGRNHGVRARYPYDRVL